MEVSIRNVHADTCVTLFFNLVLLKKNKKQMQDYYSNNRHSTNQRHNLTGFSLINGIEVHHSISENSRRDKKRRLIVILLS